MKRQLKLLALAVDFLSSNSETAEQVYIDECPYYSDVPVSPSRIELSVPIGAGCGYRSMFAPSDLEFSRLKRVGRGGRKGGDWRTRQLLTLSLVFLRDHLDWLGYHCDYLYYGNAEHRADSHIHFEGRNILRPTEDELQSIIDNVDDFVRFYRPINPPFIAWAVWDNIEDDDYEIPGLAHVDTVFCGADCDREFVRRMMVDRGECSSNAVVIC